MERVKEEAFLSIIFVGKWLALGLGVFAILYFGINTAYHKTYYDSHMAKYDLEIDEIKQHKSKLEKELTSIKSNQKILLDETLYAEHEGITKANYQIEQAKTKIDGLGLRWHEKVSARLLKNNTQAAEAYQQLADAQTLKAETVKKLKNLQKDNERISLDSPRVTKEIQEDEKKIAEKIRDKKRAEVDIKGPLMWLFGFLGLT